MTTTTFEPRSATVKIYTGDYLDRLNDLEERAKRAKAAAKNLPRLEGDVPEHLQLAEEYDALAVEADEKALRIRVVQLGRRAWKDLVAAHPPRKAETEGVTDEQAAADAEYGINLETFSEALVPASVTEPAGFDLDTLGSFDFERVFWKAMALNRGVSADPKASLVSQLTQTSDETSSKPNDSGSPSSDTEAGSQPSQ